MPAVKIDQEKAVGFYCTCKCGVVVGVMELGKGTSKSIRAGIVLSDWAECGYKITPFYITDAGIQVFPCRCEESKKGGE